MIAAIRSDKLFLPDPGELYTRVRQIEFSRPMYRFDLLN